jgi:hypothetical protein
MQLLIVVVVVAAAAAGVGADEGATAKSTSTSLLHRGHLGCNFLSITYMRQCVQAPMISCAQLAVSRCVFSLVAPRTWHLFKSHDEFVPRNFFLHFVELMVM